MDMRIGHGFDVHAFESGDHINLGGVKIPHAQAFRAHSDGDVLLHALIDALFGAAGLGDIGQHFPDTDPAWLDIDSRKLLRRCIELLQARALYCSSADMTIVAQTPKMAPHLPAMRNHIASDLQLSATRINIKATTTEHLGFCGREEGIAAYAVVLLQSSPVAVPDYAST